MNLSNAVQENFKDYAAEVILRRALVNVVDGLKPSARQIFYALHTDKFTHKNPAKSTVKLVGSGMRFYTHGDSSLVGILMRSAQPFSLRYPLIDVEGSFGNLTEAATWASPRYTKARLSEIASYMFKNIEKETISKWYYNYDDTEQFPSTLPCLGFWPLVEGSMGIGVALASSIPAMNLKEVNTALIEMLWGRSAEVPMPDFPTGATLINAKEVRESLLNGTGAAAKVRAVISYNEKENYLTVSEIPPLTYTNKICKELEELLKDPQCGIDRFLDITGEKPEIKIYLTKTAQIQQVIARLYKETSLQNTYSINMTMLDGSKPKVFGIFEAMRRHLEHEEECYLRAFTYDLEKLKNRLHIIEGYIIACANIEEVVRIIKSSPTSARAKENLITKFILSSEQTDAILKLTLSRVAALEVKKFLAEKRELEVEIERIALIINDNTLLKKEIENGLREVMTSFGDPRRTKILNLSEEDTGRLMYFTKSGAVSLSRPKSEAIVNTIMSGSPYLGVTKKGLVFRSEDVPMRTKNIFAVESTDEIISAYAAQEEDFLIIYSQDKSFRCIPISSLNKKKTTLPLTDIVDAYVSNVKITKAEYRKKER